MVWNGLSRGKTMTPTANTIYSVGLFLALIVLSVWTKRRRSRGEPHQ